MKRRAFIVGTGMFVIFNLMMLVITSTPVHAATVWSDNFDDGNFDGWITDDPDAFSASNGYLESTDDVSPQSSRPGIDYESNVSLGTWSFDFYGVGEYNDTVYFSGMRVSFWSDETTNYFIDFEPRVITFVRFVQWPGETRGTWTSPVNLNETWNHLDITIDEPFVFDIFVNGIHRIHSEYAFPPTTTPEGFHVRFGTIGEAIDNVTVSDTVDLLPNATYITTTTTEDTTTTTTDDTTTPPPAGDAIPLELLAVGIGVPVVIIVVIVGLRMRRP
ncbi:MAG: hypothetical protein KAQ65_02740 [Candidatus Thorarchaeota archaeon]|nr:hypothetical protein [Candidatus Thorarchaeota archaeon]